MPQSWLGTIGCSQYLQQLVGKCLVVKGVHHAPRELINLDKRIFRKGVVVAAHHIVANSAQNSAIDIFAVLFLGDFDSRDDDVSFMACKDAVVLLRTPQLDGAHVGIGKAFHGDAQNLGVTRFVIFNHAAWAAYGEAPAGRPWCKLALKGLLLVEHALVVLLGHASWGGEHHAVAVAFEEAHAKLVSQRGDLLRHRWLADEQLACRLREAAVFCNLQEGLHPPVHVPSISVACWLRDVTQSLHGPHIASS